MREIHAVKDVEATRLSEPVVRWLLRHLMINNILTETMQGTVMHTAASVPLAQNRDMQNSVAVAAEELYRLEEPKLYVIPTLHAKSFANEELLPRKMTQMNLSILSSGKRVAELHDSLVLCVHSVPAPSYGTSACGKL